MDQLFIQLLGFTAGTLTTFAFAPQLRRTWKTGGHDLSWTMIGLFGAGVSLWIVYGILVQAAPVIVANVLTIVQIAALAAIKRLRAGAATQTAPPPPPRKR